MTNDEEAVTDRCATPNGTFAEPGRVLLLLLWQPTRHNTKIRCRLTTHCGCLSARQRLLFSPRCSIDTNHSLLMPLLLLVGHAALYKPRPMNLFNHLASSTMN